MNTKASRKERALELLRTNRLAEAKALCQEVANTENNAGAWYLLGIIHGMLSDSKQAENCYRRAVEFKPDYADAHFQLGIALAARGRFDESVESFQETVRLMPGHGVAYAALGNAQVGLGRFEDAVTSYRRALEINAGDVETLVNLGNALSELGRKDEAVAVYRRAIVQDPRFADAYHNLGLVLLDQERVTETIDAYRTALRAIPDHPVLLADLGVALSRKNEHGEAAACYRQALSMEPNDAETHYNLANALWALGKFNEAIENYQTAIRLQPGDADAHVNLGLVCLSLGDFRQGWKEYDWQWLREGAALRPFPPSTWDGADLGGRAVFLHDEQGLGDELFFLRFVPWLRNRGAGEITYRPTAKLASPLMRVPTLDRLAARDAKPSDSALTLSIGDLPRLLGMEHTDQIPPPVGLTPLPTRIAALRTLLDQYGSPPYVGVTWRAGTTRKNALYKASPLPWIAQTLAPLEATVLILQRNPGDSEIDQFAAALGRPVHDLSALNEDLEQVLALLSLIDEYVGVSNTNMHLRAGVGKTARVLVPSPPEWRWMAEGKESPWFPGFTVYRQGYDGSWETAFTELAADLKKSFN